MVHLIHPGPDGMIEEHGESGEGENAEKSAGAGACLCLCLGSCACVEERRSDCPLRLRPITPYHCSCPIASSPHRSRFIFGETLSSSGRVMPPNLSRDGDKRQDEAEEKGDAGGVQRAQKGSSKRLDWKHIGGAKP